MRVINNKKIAVIGGGPGGLTLARLLQMNGAEVKVYERDFNKEARLQGATLDLHTDSGLKALETAGLMEAFRTNYRPGADKICIVDNKGMVFYDQHIDETPEQTFGSVFFRPEIDRGPLRKILLESLQPGTVVWNSQFISMSPIDNSWKLDFLNGTSIVADIVIGADGANSKIRPYITSLQPFYSGVTAIEGNVYDAEVTVPHIYKLLRDGKIFAFGTKKTFIVSSKGDGSVAFYMGFKAAENWANDCGVDFADRQQVLDWFKKDFSEWSMVWHELIDNTKNSFIQRPIYCAPLDQTWDTLPNLTILGDAAHLMPPYAGEGVNMAMLDALELSEWLLDDKLTDIEMAIACYENQMRSRAAAAAKMSMENTEWMHADGALPRMMDMFALQ